MPESQTLPHPPQLPGSVGKKVAQIFGEQVW
jgi:hypothetical protein